MTETEFLACVDRILDSIETRVDDWSDTDDVEVECARNGNVLTLSFDSGERVVINSQAPMREIWLASLAGAHHYRQQSGLWVDTRGGEDLAQRLATVCSAAGGKPITFDLG